MSKWITTPLGDIFEIARGGSPRPIQKFLTDDPNGLNWIMIGDTVDGSKYITATKKRIRPEGLKKSRMVHEGDFLLTNSMSFGRPYILKTSGCIHDGWLVLSPRDHNVHSDFFYYLLGSGTLYREFSRRAAGAVVKNLNTALVRSVEIPFPPLAEQRRIAAILDAADALRAKRRETLAQLDTLLQSTFLDMFGDPVTNPMGWQKVTIGDLVENIDSGWSPSCLDRPADKDGWGVLKLGAVTSCEYRDDQSKGLPDDIMPRPEIEVKKGDLLFTRKNTYDLVAACAFVHATRPKLLLPDLIFRFRFANNAFIEPMFVWQQLINPKLRKKIQSLAGGAAGSMPNISKAKLRGVELTIPPLDLQCRFATIVESVEKQKVRLRTHLAELDTLFASLQSRAFNGELSP